MNRFAGCLLALTTLCSACSGRDPAVTRANDKALIVPDGAEGEGEGEPATRTLSTARLFGTMPVTNRMLDPLITLTTNGWLALAPDFNNYAAIGRRVMVTPTQTPALEILAAGANPGGAVVIGTYKSSRARQAVSMWFSGDNLADVTASVLGTFVPEGEQSVALAVDDASTVVLDGRSWTRFDGVLPQGPVGWASLFIESHSTTAVLLSGAVAEDVTDGAGAGAVVRERVRTALTPSQRRALAVLAAERSKQLGAPTRDVAHERTSAQGRRLPVRAIRD